MITTKEIIVPLTGVLAIIYVLTVKNREITRKPDIQEGYVVSGKIKNTNNGWVYLAHTDYPKKNMKVDSTRITNGEFSFSGSVKSIEPFLLGLPAKDKKGQTIAHSILYRGPIILSAGKLYIEGDYDTRSPLSANGTKAQQEYNVFKNKHDALNFELNRIIRNLYTAKKSEENKIDSLNIAYSTTERKIQEGVKSHIMEYPNSDVSAYITKSVLTKADASTLKFVYEKLTPQVRDSFFGNEVQQMLLAATSVDIGGTAPTFSLPDVSGKQVSLTSFKGNYVLIDFWASWCGPCRREHPNLIKLHNRYKNEAFKIIGISMDNKREPWLKAISEDNLPWIQLCDLKALQSEISKKYGVATLPMNFLIDKEGKIVGRNLTSGDLNEKLKQLF